MSIQEIVLPETTPHTEWVRGHPLQKMSALRDHARIQLRFGAALDAWARHGHGEVGTEWRFRLAPPGEIMRPLIPDIAFVQARRLRELHGGDLQSPPIAPDVAVEILSSTDVPADVDHKIDIYLRSGSSLVISIDPMRQRVQLHDTYGVLELIPGDSVEHIALPGFIYPVAEIFQPLTPPS